MRCFGILAVLGFLAGCTNTNIGLSRVQLSSDTTPFPTNYQSEVARILAERGGNSTRISASYPRRTTGATAFDPQRWYVCVRGISDVLKPRRLPRPAELIDQLFDPSAMSGEHNVVLFFSTEGRRPSVQEGFDSPLCRDGDYGPVKAEAPLI